MADNGWTTVRIRQSTLDLVREDAAKKARPVAYIVDKVLAGYFKRRKPADKKDSATSAD